MILTRNLYQYNFKLEPTKISDKFVLVFRQGTDKYTADLNLYC